MAVPGSSPAPQNWGGGLLLVLAAISAGCARPQPSAEELAGPTTPTSALRLGPTPLGGPSQAATGAGAGGSAAAGYEAGRVGSSLETPTAPPQPYGITDSRMSPVGSSGSGLGDRGNPIPPEVSLTAPPDALPRKAMLKKPRLQNPP